MMEDWETVSACNFRPPVDAAQPVLRTAAAGLLYPNHHKSAFRFQVLSLRLIRPLQGGLRVRRRRRAQPDGGSLIHT